MSSLVTNCVAFDSTKRLALIALARGPEHGREEVGSPTNSVAKDKAHEN